MSIISGTFPSAATATPAIPFVPLQPYPSDAPATGGDSLTEDLNVYYTTGDIAWMLTSTALVLLMIPGVGFFYSGLARRKSALSLLWLSVMATAVVSFQWFFWGYSLAFSHKAGKFIGALDNFAFINVLAQPSVGGSRVPDLLFAIYQGMFAAITVALAVGAVAERGRMLPCIVFMFIWSTVVYDPIACWTWNPAGWSFQMGGLDFAGGTPVHIASGSAALAYSYMLGKRRGHGTQELNYRPHNVTQIESSIQKGLAYVVASLSIFDEYSNDVLDMPAGSYFPRPRYRKQELLHSGTLSRPTSFNREKQDGKKPLHKTMSFKNKVLEYKPIKLLGLLLIECKRHGEALIAEGVITAKDIEETKSNKDGSRIIAIGLPAYCILQALLRSIKANSDGLLLSDQTELTLENKPKDTFFEWFLEPLLILKDQIKSVNLSEEEENYLCKLVLLVGDPKRVGDIDVGMILQNERRQAEIGAFARRLQGITKSISRYPTYKRRFDDLVKILSEELEKKIGGSLSSNGSRSTQRSISGFSRLFSQKSFGRKTSNKGVNDQGEVHP